MHLGPQSSVIAATTTTKPPVVLENVDFHARFHGQRWEVAWKWKSDSPVLKNRVAEYAVDPEIRKDYDAEVSRWIEQGWLEPCKEPKGGIIPMLAVQQKAKNKV